MAASGQIAASERPAAAIAWKQVLTRPAQLLALSLAILLVVAVAVLGVMAWREQRRVERIRLHVGHTARVQQLSLHLQQSLVLNLVGAQIASAQLLGDLRQEIAEIRVVRLHLDPRTDERLAVLAELLGGPPPIPQARLVAALGVVREIVIGENQAQARLLSTISEDASRGLSIAIAILLGLPALALLAYWTLRERIVRPLDDLRALLGELASGQFRAISADGVHPILVPLFRNYNHLVTRLEELEAQHRSRARSLESEVRNATEALLEQQRTLARAERLAAAGEMAAGLAHELRNPLAGVLLSLANLRRDISDPDLVERINLLTSEIERLTRLLNQHLSSARHAPEPPRPVQLRSLIDELLALVRYQVPEQVQLESDVAAELECILPRDRVRQALLNLVLNSVQAIGAAPGHIRVSATRRDRALALAVGDDGPGFPAEILRTGAQTFSSCREGGTGLGLAMVRRVALDLGGDLLLENTPPHGARVRLLLPCSHD